MSLEPGRIAAEADRCVKCGLCLPACPTYRLTADEGDSARGRVALIQGLDQGQLADSRRLRGHLDRCLGCQACETACPSGVSVTGLVDAARARHLASLAPPQRAVRRLFLGLLTARSSGRRLFGLLRRLQGWGLLTRPRLPAGWRLGRMERLLPPLQPASELAAAYPPLGPERGQVNLFAGCLAQQVEPEVTTAAIRVLRRLGFRVLVPAAQVCCGAMHLHNGDRETARRLAERNLRAFAAGDAAPLLTSASGCGAHLMDYGRLLGSSESGALAARVSDIAQFLANQGWPDEIRLLPLPARVAVHDPCSLVNAMGQAAGAYRLLARIPGLRLEPLADNQTCCGAAGTYMIQQPAISAALGADKIERLRQAGPDLVVTSNPGCALQLRAGLREAGLALEVLHPIELIARQLPAPDNMR